MLLLLSFFACSDPASSDAEDTGETGAPAPTGPSGAAIAEPTCAPDDGLAVRFVVGLDGEGCDAAFSSVPHVRIALWTSAPLAPATYPFDAATGSAWYAADGGAEEFGHAGEVVIEAWGEAVTGAYTVELDSGESIAGTFTAAWCETDPRCG